MRTQARNRSRAGFTLIEVAIAALMFVLMMSLLGVVSVTSQSAYHQASLSTKLDTQGRRAVARVAEELTTISGTMMNPDPTGVGGTSQIDFQQALGIVNGAVTWGPLTRIGFEYEVGEVNDGQDNDGDGLIDEGVVALTRDVGGVNQKRVVLCREVREMAVGEVANGLDDNGNGVVDEGGFNIQRVGDVMTIRLWLETPGEGGETVGRLHRTTVRLRNVGI